jgi:hypothetical protein
MSKMNLKADPNRAGIGETGIYLRAKRGHKWASVDLAELDRESVLAWLNSREGIQKTLLAQNVVLVLLGHEQQSIGVE